MMILYPQTTTKASENHGAVCYLRGACGTVSCHHWRARAQIMRKAVSREIYPHLLFSSPRLFMSLFYTKSTTCMFSTVACPLVLIGN